MTSMALPGHINLNDLVVFCAVVDAGGFTAAAARLGVAPAKVSIEIGRLESQLGITLFTRTTRKVTLTEAGQTLYEECQPLLLQLQAAIEHRHAENAELSGSLRLTATVDHAVQSLGPALAEFTALHPALHVELRTGDRVVDLVAEGMDLAIRMGWLRDSSLRAVRLGDFAQYVVASPQYLRGVRRPTTPEDLGKLDWVALTLLPTPLTWTFSSGEGVTQTIQLRSRIKVDSPGTLRSLLRHGAGVSVLDQYSAQPDLESGLLVRLLDDWSLPRGGIHAVFPPGRHISRKAQAFAAFYQDYLRRTKPDALPPA
jgi:DNA-binding transcriptional LysR family regulator